jgi:hypothetical protein
MLEFHSKKAVIWLINSTSRLWLWRSPTFERESSRVNLFRWIGNGFGQQIESLSKSTNWCKLGERAPAHLLAMTNAVTDMVIS